MAGSGTLEVAAARLEGFVRERLALPGLAVGLTGPGGWRREFAVGVADVASGRPLAPDALLPVASIGKVMTAVALFREHQAGRLDLDAPVHQHLPWLPLATPFGPITVRHLLGHTAGIVAGLEPLVPLPDGRFRVGDDPDTPERATFEAEVDGRPARVVVSGWPFDRVD